MLNRSRTFVATVSSIARAFSFSPGVKIVTVPIFVVPFVERLFRLPCTIIIPAVFVIFVFPMVMAFPTVRPIVMVVVINMPHYMAVIMVNRIRSAMFVPVRIISPMVR